MPDFLEDMDRLLNEQKENLKTSRNKYNKEFNEKLRILEEQSEQIMKDSKEIEDKLKKIDENLESLGEDFNEITQDHIIISDRIKKIEQQSIKNSILNTPDILSRPWDPWEGFLDTMYLSGGYIVEFWDFVVKTIREFLKENDVKSKELLDKKDTFRNEFSFKSIFSKDNDKPNSVPYTGEYQCSLKMK